MEQRPAGLRLLKWAQTPRGEEILEGLGGGLLTGLPLFVQDYDPGAAALATATAIAGGIAMGMAGRQIGARIGKRVHKDPLADQSGVPAFIGRTTGMESLTQGIEESGKKFRGQISDYLVQQQGTKMLQEGAITQDQLDKIMNLRRVRSTMDMMEGMSDEQRSKMVNMVMQTQQKMLKDIAPEAAELGRLEQQLIQGAQGNLDVNIQKAAGRIGKIDDQGNPYVADMRNQMVDLLGASVAGEPTPITGEHVGRAIGRFIGDEIGVLGGLGTGLLAAQALGLQGPKDKEIIRLQQQLQQQGVR